MIKVKCTPICPITRESCVLPCIHLVKHMPHHKREPKALGLIYRESGLPNPPEHRNEDD